MQLAATACALLREIAYVAASLDGVRSSPMAYVLGSLIIAHSDAVVSVTVDEYLALRKAVDGLLHRIDAEEKFDAVVENYKELEEFILNQALQAVFSHGGHDHVSAQAPRSTTARKVLNFLSSARLYCSTIETHAAAITGEKSSAASVKAAMGREFDTSMSYRIMDALRNYAQHSALPVHGYTVASGWNSDRTIMDHEFDPQIRVSDLADDSNFKKETLAQIKNGPPTLKLKPLAREYLESLSNIHNDFRGATNKSVEALSQKVVDAKKRLTDNDEIPDIGIALFEVDEEGYKIGEPTNLSRSLTDYLLYLERKNRQLVNFSKRRIAY
ncbi:hypothetical protein AB8A31_15835 [Tardiphaga sp. 804_B3_N1_9]|uniref:hypothetical protein n=1 Tax=Tardiphaga sp. 804_B3_N1_9 TaxID=3240786 RepID=UPI003F28432E